MKIDGEKEKTKKEHYVPQCYLHRWENDKQQVYVFDKERKKTWPANVSDVACERFFYDISCTELNSNSLHFLKECEIDPDEEGQFIEKFFANRVENEYANLLQQMLDKDINKWYEENCCFINRRGKVELSVYMVYQLIRTKNTRKSIRDTSNCLKQWLKDMNVEEEVIRRNTIDADRESVIQGNMILNINRIIELAQSFYNLTWVLGINKSSTPLLTSDNPIGTIPHVIHPFLPMNGIGSKGVEVFFPLSPKYLLLMYDGDYHKISSFDRRYYSIDDEKDIEHYNKMCAYNSAQYIISNEQGFEAVKEILADNPEAFRKPRTILSWGNKTYKPE